MEWLLGISSDWWSSVTSAKAGCMAWQDRDRPRPYANLILKATTTIIRPGSQLLGNNSSRPHHHYMYPLLQDSEDPPNPKCSWVRPCFIKHQKGVNRPYKIISNSPPPPYMHNCQQAYVRSVQPRPPTECCKHSPSLICEQWETQNWFTLNFSIFKGNTDLSRFQSSRL